MLPVLKKLSKKLCKLFHIWKYTTEVYETVKYGKKSTVTVKVRECIICHKRQGRHIKKFAKWPHKPGDIIKL